MCACTYRSLCIIDEFGKGTLCADGVGLLCAALRHFATQQACCKLIASTHFSEVLDEQNLARSAFDPTLQSSNRGHMISWKMEGTLG